MTERFINFFKQAEKKEADFMIGAEFEHFIIEKTSRRTITYAEEKGIKYILTSLAKEHNWKADFINENIIGLHKKEVKITLEPAGQLEISIVQQQKIKTITEIYFSVISDLLTAVEPLNYEIVALSYQPCTSIKEIPMIPKKRYKLMYNYFANKGSLAHNMMKGTAAIQAAIDFSSEEDFIKKIRLAYKMSPLISLIFDNSFFFEGKYYPHNLLRQTIWQNCDDERCGILPCLFKENFGYDVYANYILNIPPIFILDKNHEIKKWDKPLKFIYSDKWDEKQFRHTFSMHFPDVRARNYIEIRVADALPYPMNICLLYFYQAIFYNKSAFEKINSLLGHINDRQTIKNAINDISSKGFKAKYGEKDLTFYTQHLSRIVRSVYNDENRHYLKVVNYLLNTQKSYKHFLLEKFPNLEGILTAISLNDMMRCKSCVNH